MDISAAILNSFASRYDENKLAVTKLIQSETEKIRSEVVERRMATVDLLEQKIAKLEERKANGERVNEDVLNAYSRLLKQAEGA